MKKQIFFLTQQGVGKPKLSYFYSGIMGVSKMNGFGSTSVKHYTPLSCFYTRYLCLTDCMDSVFFHVSNFFQCINSVSEIYKTQIQCLKCFFYTDSHILYFTIKRKK